MGAQDDIDMTPTNESMESIAASMQTEHKGKVISFGVNDRRGS